MSSMKLQCLSHTPLMGLVDPDEATVRSAMQALRTLKEDLETFDPELIFLFAPDHYNGFFYDLMPSFCIGAAASSIGDYGCRSGPLNVPGNLAIECVKAVQAAEVDCAVSFRMQVDHGFAQPLELLTGALDRYPVIPVFINSLAAPLPSFKRARLLGNAVGLYAATLGRRVLFMGSGGLSHNPPAPSLAGATPEVAERLIAGRNLSAEQRNARQQRTIDVAREFAGGGSTLHQLNPAWDKDFLERLKQRDLIGFDKVENAQIGLAAGESAHEVKTWLAANAAMAAATGGRYVVRSDYYAPIPEWIAGFSTLQGDEQADYG
ncbi:3-carboxyethylcatechol 2,3-dioxygenase [Eoetvoesiella caeni]